MSLESIYYIGQSIAVIAILGSLIILIIQMRQANEMTRKAAYYKQMEDLQLTPKALFETPGVADIWFRGNQDMAKLTDAERVSYISCALFSFRTWEALHAQYVQGDVKQEIWDIHRKQLRYVVLAMGKIEIWALISNFLSKQFQEFMDGLSAEVKTFAIKQSEKGNAQADLSDKTKAASGGDAP